VIPIVPVVIIVTVATAMHSLHNPLKNPEKYKVWGDLLTDVTRRLQEPATEVSVTVT
jgi:phage-related protein